MKKLAKCLGSVTLILIVIFAYLVAGTRLMVSVTGETIIPAAQESERFAQALRKIKDGAIDDKLYTSVPTEDINEYSFIVLDLSIRSFGLLPCEWIQAGIAPMQGDIALVEADISDVGPLSRETPSLWILAEAGKAQTGHRAWIEYYAFGYPTVVDAKPRTEE